MSRPLCYYPAKDAMPCEGQIANQVKHFMAHEFVIVTKRPILYRASAENNSVLFRSSAYQAHVAQHLLVFAKAEGAGRSNLRAVRTGCQINGEGLAADRVGKMDVVCDAVAFAGIDSNELTVLTHFDTFQDAQVLPAATLTP